MMMPSSSHHGAGGADGNDRDPVAVSRRADEEEREGGGPPRPSLLAADRHDEEPEDPRRHQLATEKGDPRSGGSGRGVVIGGGGGGGGAEEPQRSSARPSLEADGNDDEDDDSNGRQRGGDHGTGSPPRRQLTEPLLRRNRSDSAPRRRAASAVEEELPATQLLGVHQVNRMFAKAANIALFVYVSLLALVYTMTPPENWRYLAPQERQAAASAALVLAVAFVLVMSRFAFASRNSTWRQHTGGIVYASIVTQAVATCTNLLLAFAPSVVAVDPVTLSRVFLLRWCEWIPLGGLMTFLSEGVGMPKRSGLQRAILVSLSQSLSCVGGIIFPFCPGPWSWSFWMTISIVTYGFMFERVHSKRKLFLVERSKTGSTFLDKEHLDRLEFAYHLIAVCTVVWTILVVLYFVNMLLHWYLPPTHRLLQQEWSLAMLCDTCFDVIAKGIYMKLIVDVHFCVFDADGRAQRQLGELRNLMSVLWDSSSDAIVISARKGDRVTSLASPSFLPLVSLALPEPLGTRKGVALLIEMERRGGGEGDGEAGENPQGAAASSPFEVNSATYIDCSDIPYGGLRGESVLAEASLTDADADQVSDLVYASWKHSDRASSETILMFQLADRRCEIKVSRHSSSTLVAVIRDVTERFKRLEAERKAHFETMARQKDAQSQTRFVRHEVKNGLLAGIELCDSLRNAMDDLERTMDPAKVTRSRDSSIGSSSCAAFELAAETAATVARGTATTSIASVEPSRSADTLESDDAGTETTFSLRPRRLMEELDVTLHEVLDTVLAEAMARDVIHEVYQPRSERLDVLGLFHNFGPKVDRDDRFPVIVAGPPIPYLMLDPQLLRYIHRNAISNACKYGEQGGPILTELSYDIRNELFRISVKNQPGPAHDNLVALGDRASDVVFAQGSMLHKDVNNQANYISSGDGAWIMQKCAKTMSGKCEIAFHECETVFTFTCPAEPLRVVELPDTQDFQVPPDTWGIAVDDSRIQRKLMSRILGHVGLEEERRVILGATPSEVYDLENVIRDVLKKKEAGSKVLVLVDENLDFCECECEPVVLSGSLIMMDILARMSPDEEEQLFVLVRSANDSRDDVALYTSRCHGFFPKAPMQRQRIRELLAPLWAERFFNHPLVPK